MQILVFSPVLTIWFYKNLFNLEKYYLRQLIKFYYKMGQQKSEYAVQNLKLFVQNAYMH